LLANYTLSKVEASKLSVFANLSTIVSITAGALFLHEEVTAHHWIGFFMIIVGILGTNVSMARKQRDNVKVNRVDRHLE
jgi:drug/metabolite transporter (DMT)-like permease